MALITLGPECPCDRLSARVSPALGFHHINENVVNAGQMALALGFQPFENLWVQPDTHRNFPPDVAQAH